eukprot:13448149-Alexandrium_andersonii.AAC.1
MSASLVGSEMCIRDRSRTPPTPPGIAPRTVVVAASNEARIRDSTRGGGCLLYTSDAADDM